jgi:hypothetical protein
LVVLPLSLFRLKNRVCLSRGVQVTGATCRAATRIVAVVRDLVQRTGDDYTGRVLGDRMIVETRNTGFLVEPQNKGRRFPDLCLKIDSSNLVICASKSP